MALQTLTFAVFILFNSVKAVPVTCKSKSPNIIQKGTVFSAAIRENWIDSSIAVNQNGTIQVWTPNANIRQWTKSNKEGDADPSSPVEISNDGKFVAFVDKIGFTVVYDQTLWKISFKRNDIDKATSISLSTDASTMAVGNTKSVIVYHYNIITSNWDRSVIPLQALPDTQSIYVKLSSIGTTLVVTQFTSIDSWTQTFSKQESGWKSFGTTGSGLQYVYARPDPPRQLIGQSIISITDKADKMTISGENTLIYLLGDVSNKWSDPISIQNAISNSMTGDGSHIVVGFVNDVVQVKPWTNDGLPSQYFGPAKYTVSKSKNSSIVSINSINDKWNAIAIDGQAAGIYDLTCSNNWPSIGCSTNNSGNSIFCSNRRISCNFDRNDRIDKICHN